MISAMKRFVQLETETWDFSTTIHTAALVDHILFANFRIESAVNRFAPFCSKRWYHLTAIDAATFVMDIFLVLSSMCDAMDAFAELFSVSCKILTTVKLT